MAGEENIRASRNPREIVSHLTSFLRMMQNEEKKADEHESWLKENIEDDTLREILSIKAETNAVGELLPKINEMIPALLTLLDPNQFKQFAQELNTALGEIERELAEKQQRLDEVNADFLT